MKPTTRPMTADEIEAVKCLSQPTYPVASWDKRFARFICESLQASPPTITDKAAPQLWRLFYRYRRQIQHIYKYGLLAIAVLRKAPDFRNPANHKAQEQQAQIDRLKVQAAQEEEAANAAIAETASQTNDVLLL